MSDKLTIMLNGKSEELFMSFGLLNEVSQVVGDVENLPMVVINPDMREKCLQVILSERDDDGKITKKFNFYKAKITIDEVNKIVEWVSENLFDFFLKALEGANNLREKGEPKLQSLMSSLAGSLDSASTKLAAGLSTQSPAS
jgi:hypothetical protein